MMLKVFRKIRQKLLLEGKLRNYFFYALGEILLVVIGILLALQVNNWNESRKSRIKEKELLTNLVDNLNINVKQLRGNLEWDNDAINSADIILEIIKGKKEYSDSLDIHFHRSRRVATPYLTSTAYLAIENQGFDIVSSKDLRKKILKLFDDTYPSMMVEIRNIDENVLKPKMQNYMIDNFESSGYPKPNDFSKLIEDQRYINILTFNRFILEYFTSLRQHCLEEAENLVVDIEKELDK